MIDENIVSFPSQSAKRIVESKVLLMDEFLNEAGLNLLFQFVEENKKLFESSAFFQNEEKLVDPEQRKSLWIDNELDPIVNLLVNGLLDYSEQLKDEFHCEVDSAKKYFCSLVASNDGDFFAPHRDNGYGVDEAKFKDTQNTAVFYFHKEPKNFEGGELFVWDRYQDENGRFLEEVPSQGCQIEPLNNRMVIFNGSCLHEAQAVKCQSKEFMDSRFCVVLRLP